jgi:proliferating cell nuclear antigen
MKIVISNKKKFKIFSNVFRYLPIFMDTVNINVTDNGLYMQGMDTSHVCLFELKLVPDWFDIFEKDKNYVLGMHCTTFYKVIQCIEDVEQTMTLSYDDEDKLNIAIESKDNSKVNKYFEIPLIDINSEILDIPETEYTIDMEINSNSITNYITELSIFDEEFTIICNQNKISMKSKSESGCLRIEMSEDSILLYAIEEDIEEIEQVYSLKYVKDICSFSKITDSVVINLKEENPMRIHQSLDDVDLFNESKNYLRFYIAPKMED